MALEGVASRRDAAALRARRPAMRKRVRPWYLVDNIAGKTWSHNPDEQPAKKFEKYNVVVDIPTYTDEVYENNLLSQDWSRKDTDALMALYRECGGKWAVIIDRWEGCGVDKPERPLEHLKKRFYSVQATTMELQMPRASMTASDFERFTMLSTYDPHRDSQRRQLAEGHMHRRQSEADEESVLLAELQKIMANQAAIDVEREELRQRLDYPHAGTNGYQYGTSQALTALWQQLLAADRLRKTQRLKPVGAIDIPQSATRDRNSITHPPSEVGSASRDRHVSVVNQTGDSLSAADKARFGVLQTTEKLPSGVTFASDKLTKPRIAKSTIQTDKIASILTHVGVPDIIPLPTPGVIESFDGVMSRVHTLLDMRKLAEKEDQEIKTREAELEQKKG